MSGIDELRALNKKVLKRFRYVPDSKTHPGDPDHWQQHWDRLEADEDYVAVDDCDGLAATVVEGLLKSGWSRDKVFLVMVGTRGSNKIDHLIAVAETDDGERYVVGDTMGVEPRLVARSPHKFFTYVRLDDRKAVKEWPPEKETA